jgi:Zn-dependent metalloprotease
MCIVHVILFSQYNFYFDNFGRDSLDDRGMTIVSNVDFGKDFVNAFFDGSEVYYGSGDGKLQGMAYFLSACVQM